MKSSMTERRQENAIVCKKRLRGKRPETLPCLCNVESKDSHIGFCDVSFLSGCIPAGRKMIWNDDIIKN